MFSLRRARKFIHVLHWSFSDLPKFFASRSSCVRLVEKFAKRMRQSEQMQTNSWLAYLRRHQITTKRGYQKALHQGEA